MALSNISPGQPLDVGFINNIISQVNTHDTIINSSNLLSQSNINGTVKRTSGITVVAGTASSIALKQAPAGTQAVATTWPMPVTFSTNPVVVGTIVNTASDYKNKQLILNITSISTSAVNFEIISTAGMSNNSAISVNFIAIGLVN
jgi:Sec7-like guanine-nucleotide exchange factor